MQYRFAESIAGVHRSPVGVTIVGNFQKLVQIPPSDRRQQFDVLVGFYPIPRRFQKLDRVLLFAAIAAIVLHRSFDSRRIQYRYVPFAQQTFPIFGWRHR